MSVTESSVSPNEEERQRWKAHWETQGMPWRTQPQITEGRQQFLTARRAVPVDISRNAYPFKDVPLTRDDLEWLLATHESGGIRGPVDWDDTIQRKRQGLDLRGAILDREILDGLPLARIRGSLSGDEYDYATAKQRDNAAIHLAGASLRYARLEGCALTRAHLEGANLHFAHLEGADLYRAHLEGEEPADLTLAILDSTTRIDAITLANSRHVGPRIEGISWNGARLGGIDWQQVLRLGDEVLALWNPAHAADKYLNKRFALQAYRQLAAALRDQGLNEYADHFGYKAQVIQRRLLVRQGHLIKASGSWLLDLTSGYGYRPLRSLIAYIVIVCLFAGAFLFNAQFAAPHLTWDEALVLSISSFHGRGFFSSGISLGDTLARLAAGEAILGLLIEISFIATFTQRFFAR